MDKLQDYEVDAIISNIPYTDINQWEQCRLMVYTISQIMSKKQLSPKDVLKFPWDNNNKEVNKTSISNEEIARLKELSNKIGKNL